jgi:hypothetical protein
VEESTLATLEISLSNDSSSQQNSSIAFQFAKRRSLLAKHLHVSRKKGPIDVNA